MRLRRKITIVIILLGVAAFFYFTRKPTGLVENPEEIRWGVAFSKAFATEMELDWRKLYAAILGELEVERLRLPVYWQDVEPEPGKYDFSDYDWMIEEAQKEDVELILVVGRKLPRWPECHIPFWADELPEPEKQEKILNIISLTVERYKDIDNLYLWQVDNEPFLPFGECTTTHKDFLDQEVSRVRELDPDHEIMVTDSGELSIWVRAAKRADVFGTTMYRIVHKDPIGYFKYPLPPKFFWVKANIVHLFFPEKPIIVSELQTEPWGPKLIYDLTLSEQEKSMSLDQFRDNIEYAREAGFPEVYLWGAEWWYWLKVKHEKPEFWEEAKILFSSNKNK